MGVWEVRREGVRRDWALEWGDSSHQSGVTNISKEGLGGAACPVMREADYYPKGTTGATVFAVQFSFPFPLSSKAGL